MESILNINLFPLNMITSKEDLIKSLETVFNSYEDDDFELDLELFEEKKKKLYVAS